MPFFFVMLLAVLYGAVETGENSRGTPSGHHLLQNPRADGLPYQLSEQVADLGVYEHRWGQSARHGECVGPNFLAIAQHALRINMYVNAETAVNSHNLKH
ncbi:unnamed protein product [Protopolystoma xenopodis]|uniref:Secreted protein n=1 Tax=Protopolystoma xenopodis TaxID=117903 RepID=A0A448WTA7_9PLAT|nr:unnamed protein product [Protopolystoma xenopodis]